MSEETVTEKQRKKAAPKSSSDWADIAIQIGLHAASAALSGFCIAAGGAAFSAIARTRGAEGSDSLTSAPSSRRTTDADVVPMKRTASL